MVHQLPYWRHFHEDPMKKYYDAQDELGRCTFGKFKVGTVVGVVINMTKGSFHFYKDGEDLGLGLVDYMMFDGVIDRLV